MYSQEREAILNSLHERIIKAQNELNNNLAVKDVDLGYSLEDNQENLNKQDGYEERRS